MTTRKVTLTPDIPVASPSRVVSHDTVKSLLNALRNCKNTKSVDHPLLRTMGFLDQDTNTEHCIALTDARPLFKAYPHLQYSKGREEFFAQPRPRYSPRLVTTTRPKLEIEI